jgi:hypothetical protein
MPEDVGISRMFVIPVLAPSVNSTGAVFKKDFSCTGFS